MFERNSCMVEAILKRNVNAVQIAVERSEKDPESDSDMMCGWIVAVQKTWANHKANCPICSKQ